MRIVNHVFALGHEHSPKASEQMEILEQYGLEEHDDTKKME